MTLTNILTERTFKYLYKWGTVMRLKTINSYVIYHVHTHVNNDGGKIEIIMHPNVDKGQITFKPNSMYINFTSPSVPQMYQYYYNKSLLNQNGG